MKKLFVASLILGFVIIGCARTWQFKPIEQYRPAGAAPPAQLCQSCHQSQHESWLKNRHGSMEYMSRIQVKELQECGACHTDIAAHAENPAGKVPPSIAKMTKTEQNNTCGKCHYNQDIFGKKAINPHDKHALFMSVGLEGKKRQIACLDCHSGHQGKSEMLVSIKAHVCYKCHKGAIVTMGVFQPFNYLTFGKMCQACHSIHGGSSGAQYTRMGVGFCIICHFAGTALTN